MRQRCACIFGAVFLLVCVSMTLAKPKNDRSRDEASEKDKPSTEKVHEGSDTSSASVELERASSGSEPASDSKLDDRNTSADFQSRYEIISERNIFLQQRSRGSSRPSFNSQSSDPTSRPAAIPEKSFVLTGIVLEDHTFRAYVEDVSKSQILKLEIGSQVARGEIIEIAIDAIAYGSGDIVTWVEVGNDLTGTPRTSTSTTSSATVATAAGTSSTQPAGTNAASLSVEERMRLNRIQQMNPGK
jgi:hypothetical protein